MTRVVTQQKVQWMLAALILSLIAASGLQRYLGHVMAEPDLDFYDYFFESAMVADHPKINMYPYALSGNPQSVPSPIGSEVYLRAQAAGFTDVNIYPYPPLLADLLIPLTHLPARTAGAVWRVMNLLAAMLAILLLANLIGLRLVSVETGLLLFACLATWPIHETIMQGQISIMLFALWVIAILAYKHEKIALSAIAIAIATWLKVTPVMILPVFLLWNTRKDRRWIAWYIVAMAAGAAGMAWFNGWQNLILNLRVLANMSGSHPAFPNKCISAVVAWFYYHHPPAYAEAKIYIHQAQPHILTFVSKVLSLGFYVACLALVRFRRPLRSTVTDKVLVLATFPIVLLLVSPVSWRHGYSAGLILLAILWTEALASPTVREIRFWLLALTTFTIGTVFFDLAAQAHLPGLVRSLCASTWPIFCLLLCIDVLWQRGNSATESATLAPALEVA